MDKFRSSLIFQCLIFLIPLNIYMWGDWLLVDVQWAFFRFQQSELGNSLILGHKDRLYIYLGLNTGIYNIAAAGLWTIGSIVLFVGLIITIYAAYVKEEPSLLKKSSIFTITGGIILGLSAVFRFEGGFAIPIGVPIILVIGWWIYHKSSNDEGDEMGPGNDLQEVSDSL
jgi:hypothetical protein